MEINRRRENYGHPPAQTQMRRTVATATAKWQYLYYYIIIVTRIT